jgi:hypothetical protein
MVGGSNETSRRTIIPSSLAAANDDARQTTRIWRFSPNSHTDSVRRVRATSVYRSRILDLFICSSDLVV